MRQPIPREHATITTYPLIYEALSGEFRPPTDPDGRIHTLARLAYAAATRGEEIEPPALDTATPRHFEWAFRYVPRWAPVSAVALTTGNDSMDLHLDGLRVIADGGTDFIAYRDVVDGEEGLRLITHEENFFPLQLGVQLTAAQLAVSEAAQQYFDRLG